MALFIILISPQMVSAQNRTPAGFKDLCANGFSELARPLNWGRLTPKKGAAVQDAANKTIDNYNPDFIYHDLGQGNEGTVYRVTPPQSPAYIIKQYRSAGNRDGDRQSLDYIRSTVRRIESPTVEVVDSVDVGQRSMRLTDVHGRDLEDVLEKAWLGDAEKKSLFTRWNQFVRAFRIEVGTDATKISGEPFSESDGVLLWSFWTKEKNGSSILVRLKPDNVLVESGTGRLIIIDPN
jgi:hypothetical protein